MVGCAAILLSALSVWNGCRREADRPWPPGVQQVPEHSPVLSPEAAARTFFLPPGYRLELVASEPLVADPVWIDIDPDGRVWVVEMRGFMPDNDAANERAPVGRIVVLDDDDDDGRMDRSTVFMDGLVLPRSVKVLEHGVLVAAPPHLWLARDTNGDGRADTRELVRDDFGRADGNPEHNANGLLWAMDNWIYTSEHHGHLRLKGGRLEHHPTLSVGQWGLSMDDMGRVLRNWNDDPLRVDLFPARYFLRNPNAVRMRGVYEQVTEDVTVWPVRPNPGVNRGYREGTLHQDRSLAVFAAAGTPTAYRGDRLPDELRGNVFVTEPAGNVVRRFVVTENQNGELLGVNPYERAEFIASTDERFRPVNLLSAPDGTLYVVDMYRGVIQHRQYQSEYLKNYIEGHRLDQPIGYGRIYRVVHRSTMRDRKPSLRRRSAAELAGLLSHPNGWWRDTAQRLLVERGDRSIADRLRTEASRAPDARTRLHALWTLDGLDAIDQETVRRALADAEPHVRAAAVRISERWLREPAHAMHRAVLDRRQDTSALVRQQLALSAGELPGDGKEDVLGDLLTVHGNDPFVVDAAVSGLAGRELRVLERILRDPAAPAADAVTMLGAAVARGNRPEDVWRVLEWVTDTGRPEGQRIALVRGIDAAFDRTAPPSLDAPAGAAQLTLRRRPAALLALAGQSGEVAREVGRILPRLDWPGKSKPRAEPPPLTAEEQQRFDAGRKVFESTCAACHQLDGRGRAKIANSLVGSRWVLGPPGLTARILLGGKEGRMMMPPVALSDEQAAAVLTYIRRAWGNPGTPVRAALVREARGASTGRTRPWTEEELLKVTQPDGWPAIR
jgi:mono/diheme cytochrome c family protein/glucose/arabinose dehydrogenase